MVITIYTKLATHSSNKAKEWLDSFHIPYEQRSFSRMKREDFLKILSLSENGIQDLITSSNNPTLVNEIEELCIQDAWFLIRKQPQIFKTPLIIDGEKLLIGYNEDKIRQFIPRDYRKVIRKSF